ncbi:MAG: hypothetical protein HY675_25330 [Chloroflexi bacterium]|nr:hypothetical protein [Chloroflexota bacterium]
MANDKEHQCMRCGATSDQRVLLSGELKGDIVWICVTCLPYLIHGA